MTWARLALACGEPSLAKLQRSVTAWEFAFWRAFEQLEGPIGYGPLVKLAAWLGWTQLDTTKITPAGVLEILDGFLQNPEAGEDEEGDEDEEALTDEEAQAKRRAEVEAKLLAIFKHPEIQERTRDDR